METYQRHFRIGVDDVYSLGNKHLLPGSKVGLLTVPFPSVEVVFAQGDTSFASNGYHDSTAAFLMAEVRLSPILTELKSDYSAFGFFINPVELFEYTGLGLPDILGSVKLANTLVNINEEIRSDNICQEQVFKNLLGKHLNLSEREKTCYSVVVKFLKEVHTARIGKLSEISKNISFSGKHLRSTFKDVFGITPKNYLQLIQVQRVLEDMSSGRGFNLTEIAYRNGFYDQSHFNLVFKKFAGLRPRTFMLGYKHYASTFRNTLVL